jgi:YesN/AraC family two-component response regulator
MDIARKSLKIIIADDDTTTRHALRLLLVDQGHVVIGEANDGEKAIDLCTLREPDMMFVDIDMPRIDGLATAERVRDLAPTVGVVVISSTPTLDNVQKALQAGASGFVVKPFNALKVSEAINNCLKQKR